MNLGVLDVGLVFVGVKNANKKRYKRQETVLKVEVTEGQNCCENDTL